MFIVNREANRISRVKTGTFAELSFQERNHLQEWLAHQPDALGEELLIIQKEFQGFDDTNERLDLLALDRTGNLVIIENKLDDSGRDVVWQVLKYASYCSSLNKGNIVEIYQQYINHYPTESGTDQPVDAATRICEFLDAPDIDEVNLNLGNSQRLMLVSAKFRKEVTSTAIWLLRKGVNIQCFKVTPYVLSEQILINIDQIVPPPDTKELIICISAKEAEEKSTESVLDSNNIMRHEYWKRVLEKFRGSTCELFDNIEPSKSYWLSADAGFKGCFYVLRLLKKGIVVDLWIGRSVTEENKFLFDFLSKQKLQIEQAFGKPLEWMRGNNKNPSSINFYCEADGFNKETWPQSIDWHFDHMTKLEQALREPLRKAAEVLEQENLKEEIDVISQTDEQALG